MTNLIARLIACSFLLLAVACDEQSGTPDTQYGVTSTENDGVRRGAKSDIVMSTQGKLDSNEKLDFNIMFKYPDGKEVSIGETLGLSSCKKMALQHVIDEKLIMKEGWGYTCCTIEEGSSCHRKIK